MLVQRARFITLLLIVRFTDLIFLLLCVARAVPLSAGCVLWTPPVMTLHVLLKSNCYIYPRIKFRAVVIFSFSESAAGASNFLYFSMKLFIVSPGQTSTCHIRLTAGRGKPRKFLPVCRIQKLSQFLLFVIKPKILINKTSFLTRQPLVGLHSGNNRLNPGNS